MNGKYVNVNTVMEKVYKNLPPQSHVNREDVVEWIWEAVSKIGAVEGNFIPMYAYLIINDYQARLPQFLQSIINVSFVTTETELISNTDELAQKERYYMSTALETWHKDFNSPDTYSNNKGYRYKINNGYMTTTFKEGIVEIAFTSFPVDEAFEPMIQENVYTIEAVVWYITKQTLYRMWMANPMYQAHFEYAERQWNFYVNSAKTSVVIPNEDGRVALADKFLRILPVDLHRNPINRRYARPKIGQEHLNMFVLTPFGIV